MAALEELEPVRDVFVFALDKCDFDTRVNVNQFVRNIGLKIKIKLKDKVNQTPK